MKRDYSNEFFSAALCGAVCFEFNISFDVSTDFLNTHNSVNCDRPGECSPETDCLR